MGPLRPHLFLLKNNMDEFLQTEIECQFEAAVGAQEFTANGTTNWCVVSREVFGAGGDLTSCWVFSTAKSWATEAELARDSTILIEGLKWTVSEDVSESRFVFRSVIERMEDDA